jgi:hypothetical protein
MTSCIADYPDESFFFLVNSPVTCAVMGGTRGWYGASGQVTAVRLNLANEFTHHFEVTASNYKTKPVV